MSVRQDPELELCRCKVRFGAYVAARRGSVICECIFERRMRPSRTLLCAVDFAGQEAPQKTLC